MKGIVAIISQCIYWIGSLTTLLCVVICICLLFSKSRKKEGERIELNSNAPEKPWSLGAWIAGVFVAGTGVALMYAPGDLVGYVNKGLNPLESVTMVALLNGAPVWALYSIMGLWYMKHMDSKIGKLAAMLSTVLGMSISLWTGMNTVTRFIGWNIAGLKFMLAAITVGIAMISAKRNLLKGMSKLAFLVFLFAFFALISTPLTDFSLTPITGGITVNFWREYFSGATAASWIFWFLSWTPTVSRWLAYISKGRTIREYIAGTMILPTIVAFVWMSVSWMYQDVIMNFSLATNITSLIPCLIFIISGILFMTGTLDSDCKVFTEDLEYMTEGKINRRTGITFYGLFVLFVFSLFISGIIMEPFAFNEYSSLVFMPLMIASIYECFKIVKRNIRCKGEKQMSNEELKKYLFIVPCAEHYNPLGIVRSLGEEGIRPIVVVLRHNQIVTSASRYIKQVYYVDNVSEGYNLIMSKWANKNSRKPFIISSDDTTTSYYDERYNELSEYFYFFNAGKQGRLTDYMDKRKMCNLAKKAGFEIPESYEIDAEGFDVNDCRYPVFTKAENSLQFGWKSAAHICYTASELKKVLAMIDGKPIVQQYIEKKNELCLDGYCWDNGKKVFVGIASDYKYILPGKYSYYMNIFNNRNKEIEENLVKMFSEIGFEGIFSVEFIIDNNGNLYFLEINFRNSTWSYASTKVGMNLVTGWCNSMIQDNYYPEKKKIKAGYTAMVELTDYVTRVKGGWTKKSVWIRDFFNADCKFFFNLRDPGPNFEYFKRKLKKVIFRTG